MNTQQWLQWSLNTTTGAKVEIINWHFEQCPISKMNVAILATIKIAGDIINARYAHNEWLFNGEPDQFSHL